MPFPGGNFQPILERPPFVDYYQIRIPDTHPDYRPRPHLSSNSRRHVKPRQRSFVIDTAHAHRSNIFPNPDPHWCFQPLEPSPMITEPSWSPTLPNPESPFPQIEGHIQARDRQMQDRGEGTSARRPGSSSEYGLLRISSHHHMDHELERCDEMSHALDRIDGIFDIETDDINAQFETFTPLSATLAELERRSRERYSQSPASSPASSRSIPPRPTVEDADDEDDYQAPMARMYTPRNSVGFVLPFKKESAPTPEPVQLVLRRSKRKRVEPQRYGSD